MKKAIVVCCILLSFSSLNFAQDISLPSSNQNLINLNPSFAGSNGFIRNQSSYYNQWPFLSGSMVTFNNAYDMYLKPLKAGLALNYQYYNQSRGTLTSNQISLIYAQHIGFKECKLKIIPSVQFTYAKKELDINRIGYNDYPRPGFVSQYPNMVFVMPVSQKYYVDFTGGLLFNYSDFYIGTSISHINRPDVAMWGSGRLDPRVLVHSTYNRKVNEKTLLQYYIAYNRQNDFSMLELGLNGVFFKHLLAGVTYRSNDNITGKIGYRNSYISTQVGYGVTVSKLAGNTAGAWIATFAVNLRKPDIRNELLAFEKW